MVNVGKNNSLTKGGLWSLVDYHFPSLDMYTLDGVALAVLTLARDPGSIALGLGVVSGPPGLARGHGVALRPGMALDLRIGVTRDNNNNKHEDFRPDVDVFDTPDSSVIYVSLPGANKEEFEVSWHSNKCELTITGAVQRPLRG